MCGIAGIFATDSKNLHKRIMKQVIGTLEHRGPDDTGIWTDEEHAITLGHKRLAVLDLSPAGHQPMLSACGRYVLLFNGEIYNHLKLREELENKATMHWNGHSDTETLLAAFAEWGVVATLQHCVGMFAIALWDRQEKKLYLARDRIGEKPLYYGWCNGAFIFASELKAFKQYPGFKNKIDRNVLALYFRFSYVPTPYSIYQGIYKLEPGSLLTIDLNGVKSPVGEAPRATLDRQGLSITRWWSLKDAVEQGQSTLINNEQIALEQLESRLRESIELQSIADVPLGAFLSGGIDSSLIVALMQSQNTLPVRTFSIGFKEPGYDEAQYAGDIAKHLKTDHTELYVSPDEAREVIPELSTLYDEPFADSSQIPTFLLTRLTRQHVTVALSGDAGDELFGGYNRYVWSQRIWHKTCWLPRPLRDILLSVIPLLPVNTWDTLYKMVSKIKPSEKEINRFGNMLYKLAEKLSRTGDLCEFYYHLVSEWQDPTKLVIGAMEPGNLISRQDNWSSSLFHENQMMYLDTMTYLPDDILCKVDRAAMGVSLETRIPYLDHWVLALAWQLPLNMKIRNGQGKWILRQLLNKYVPKDMIERPKQGFEIPLGEWLRGPLRQWAEALLDPGRLAREGFLNPATVQNTWREHLSGKRNREYQLWSVLMFETWLETQGVVN